MNVKIYSLIAIIGTNCSLFLQTKAADADLPKGGIETGERTEKSVTIMNVVDLIRRQGLKVNLEMVAGVPAKQVALGKDFISYKNLFQTAVKKLGYSYESVENRITIYSPAAREGTKGDLLSTKIDYLELSGVTNDEAIGAFAKKCNLAIIPMSLSKKTDREKKVELTLRNVTLREALSLLEESIGGRGWVSDLWTVQTNEKSSHIVIRIIL